MTQDLDSVWRAALGQLEVTISKANFTTWFKNTLISEFKDGQVVISVPSGFIKEWIQSKFHKQIKEVLSSLIPDCKDVVYKIGTGAVKETKNSPAPTSVTLEENSPSKSPDLRFTFENFVVGASNRLAHAACLAVAENPGATYNPLFIYGGTGLGKTHLMCAIANHILNKHPNKKVCYISSENFTREFITAVKSNNREGFTDRYDKIDVLLIDDIQFLAGREGTIEQFFHIFNSLHHNKKQIILSSDRPPKAISNLPHRLVSRLEGGLITDIQSPDLETRIAIVKEKAEEHNFPISEEESIIIAEAAKSNVRELEGLLNQVMAYCQLQNIKPSCQLINEIIERSSNTRVQGISPEKIIKTVASFFEIKKDDLLGQKRDAEIVYARQFVMHLLRNELNYSFPKIAKILGDRDHTTVMYGCEKIKKLLKETEHKEILQQLLDKLANQ